MQKTHVVLVILFAALAGILVFNFVDTSSNEPFATAFEMPGTTYKIKGTVDKAKGIHYDPEVDANLCTFYVTDTEGQTVQVHYRNSEDPRPQGLEQSEEIDLYGKVVDGRFESSKVMLKCPSKYDEDKHQFETAGK
ncbi:MAG: cytochrome c maturation protein CcmE [Flavobacteriales bacterium]